MEAITTFFIVIISTAFGYWLRAREFPIDLDEVDEVVQRKILKKMAGKNTDLGVVRKQTASEKLKTSVEKEEEEVFDRLGL